MNNHIIIICCIVIMICVICVYYVKRNSSCLIDDSLYPELSLFEKFSDQINEDLNNAIKTERWTAISIIDKINQDTSINTIDTDPINWPNLKILDTIRNNYRSLYEGNINTIRYFILVFANKLLNENLIPCQNIIALINGVPNVYSAYIRCINPHTVSDLYKNQSNKSNKSNKSNQSNQSIKQCIIPLSNIIGDSEHNEGIMINGYAYNYNDLLQNRKYIIFDTNCSYQFYNFTQFNTYAIVIDLKY